MSALCALTACENSGSATAQGSESKQDVDYAKLFGVNDPQAEARKASKQMKAFEERMAAKKKAEREAEWTSLLVIPPSAPTTLKAACSQLATTYETFMDKRVSGVAGDRWKATKQADIDKLARKCRDDANVKVAVCESNVFANASMYITEDDFVTIINRCEETFASPRSR
ncbi:MAG: hypothetical protein B7733_08270 [Myxococcales bacterium FL481]|nr:MAG: hypothetical protein B7733_08270 [Myxococcales bacterium FL481]